MCVHSLGVNLVDGFGGGRGDRGVVESQEAAEDVSVLAGQRGGGLLGGRGRLAQPAQHGVQRHAVARVLPIDLQRRQHTAPSATVTTTININGRKDDVTVGLHRRKNGLNGLSDDLGK